MKVLLITYYWPPAGGSGVQRWLKFVKYLQDFDVEPIVYTVQNPNYLTTDTTLLAEVPKNVTVLKHPIKTIQNYLFKKPIKSRAANVSKGGFLSWVRGNFFIPDAKKSWVKPSVKYLTAYIEKNTIDVIISTGPPHSMHLIANNLKSKFNIKWIADFRDPWTNLYYNKDFNLTSWAKKKNKKLETQVLQNATLVLTVSNSLKKEFEKKAKNVKVIPNGYDDEVLISDDFILDKKFTLAHIGLLPKQSNPTVLWKVLKKICIENEAFNKDLQIDLIGAVNVTTMQEITSFQLDEKVNYLGYFSHKKAIQYQKKAQVLLLLIPKTKNADGILTGKLFEYITAKRPILAIGPEKGDVATILEETRTGTVIDFESEKKLKLEILNLYAAYKKQTLQIHPINIAQYHRKKQTEKLTNIIKKINTI